MFGSHVIRSWSTLFVSLLDCQQNGVHGNVKGDYLRRQYAGKPAAWFSSILATSILIDWNSPCVRSNTFSANLRHHHSSFQPGRWENDNWAYSWFSSVMWSKLKIVTVQYINLRIWDMIDDCNINNLAKNQVSAVFNSRAIRRSVSSKFIEICIDTPCWCPSGWAPTWQPETNWNICHCVLLQKRKFISRGTQKN